MGSWRVPNIWPEGECWIIGGGWSLPYQFNIPDKVIKKVEAGEKPISIYSKYLKPLHDKNVIGVNIAFMLGDWVSVLYFSDAGFFRVHKDRILQFKNLKVTDVPQIDPDLEPLTTNIKRLKRDDRPGLSSQNDTIRWNFNSGVAAINFAMLAGVDRIYLLGFDMKSKNEKDNRTHWHQGFQGYHKPSTSMVFDRFLEWMPQVAHDAELQGVEILNVCEDSAIKEFKKVRLEDVLKK